MLTLNYRTMSRLADRLAPLVFERLAARPTAGDVPADLDRLLTEIEVAKILGLRPATLCTWRGRGRGPKFLRLGEKKRPPVRYRLADVVRFRDAHAHDPESKP